MAAAPTLRDALTVFWAADRSLTRTDPEYVPLLTTAGVRKTDFATFIAAAAAARPDAGHLHDDGSPDEEYSARFLARCLPDYLMAGVDPNETLLSDMVAWVIASLPDLPLDLPSAWSPYTPHGWLFHAAGVSLDEALAMRRGSQRALRSLAALRGAFAPTLPRGTSLIWPRAVIVY